jgi:hypothetical protein
MDLSKEEEIDIANKIKEKYNIYLIINKNIPYSLYCANHIGDLLELKNIRAGLSKYKKDEIVKVKYDTKGGNQNTNFFTIKGLIRILSKTRKEEIIDFCNFIGLNIHLNIYPCIEIDTIKCIIETFNGESMIKQYRVKNFLIDLYFDKYKIAIECDEDHKNIEKDNLREDIIKKELNCIFIRYKPYSKDFNIFSVLNKIYKNINRIKD